MSLLQNACVQGALFLLLQEAPALASKIIDATASPGNHMVNENYNSEFTTSPWDGTSASSTINIACNVPITIQRYYDDYYMEGMQPVGPSDVKVLVTSNCTAYSMPYVPKVTWGDGSIEIIIDGATQTPPLYYLDSSSYHATWSYESGWCRRWQDQSDAPTPAPLEGEEEESTKLAVSREITSTGNMNEDNGKEMKAWGAREKRSPCIVNVEVLIDACSHGANVSAPMVRVVDAILSGTDQQENSDDSCVTDLEADILFNESRAYRVLGHSVRSVQCHRAVPGRPFVDSTGRAVRAFPVVEDAGYIWSSTLVTESTQSPSLDNITTTVINQNLILLGNEWTKNALGEHASVASFSAFSIALMTNQAPSDLVEDALIAALDEVRHAKTSFDIASRLTGQEVRPGALPPSKHVFGQDLKAMAMALATEGCVDETLSALEAAAEAGFIKRVLADGADGTKYSSIDRDVLAWIGDELQIIALEEGNHAALAWRTFKWVCSVDSHACEAVKEQVLNKDELEKAFQLRFASFYGQRETLEMIKDDWRMIYSDGIGFEARQKTCTDEEK